MSVERADNVPTELFRRSNMNFILKLNLYQSAVMSFTLLWAVTLFGSSALQAATLPADAATLLLLAKYLDPSGKALPHIRSNNTTNWCKDWLATGQTMLWGEPCIRDHVKELRISPQGLKAVGELEGSLPSILPNGAFAELENLAISGIKGTLPPWVFTLPQVGMLSLDLLQQAVGLPNSLPPQSKAQWYDISLSGIKGTIPDWVFTPPQLSSLSVAGTQNSTLPSTLPRAALTKLRSLALSGLGGPLPGWIFTLPQLEELSVEAMAQATLPNTLPPNMLAKLNSLAVSGISRGPLPGWVFRLPTLYTLSLGGFGQSALPGLLEPGAFAKLGSLALSDFGGSVPEWTFTLPALRSLLIKGSSQGTWLPVSRPQGVSKTTNSNADNELWNMPRLYSLSLTNISLPEWVLFLPDLTELSMINMSLPSSIPQGALARLQTLVISGMGIQGTLPQWVMLLPELYSLSVAETSLGGMLPAWDESAALRAWPPGKIPTTAPAIGIPLSQLTRLNITRNYRFSGSLPRSWVGLTSLRSLHLNNNNLTGTLPASWANMSFWLRNLDLSENKLYGTVPEEWADVATVILRMSMTLNSVLLRGNKEMRGCVPPVWGKQYSIVEQLDINATGLQVCSGRFGDLVVNMFNAPLPGWSSPNCDVRGYTLVPRQLPQELLLQTHAARVQLYTLHTAFGGLRLRDPAPLPTLASAASACDVEVDCVMFTSDGFLIGAYRVPPWNASQWQEVADIEKQQGWVAWKPMLYCSGRCCGTYVVQGLDLTIQPQQSVQAAEEPVMEYPVPSSESEALSFMSPAPLCTAVLPGTMLSSLNAIRQYNLSLPSIVINSTQMLNCPQQCKFGCCALMGILQEKESGKALSLPWDITKIGLDQCNSAQCSRCGFSTMSFYASSPGAMLQTVWRLCAKRKGACTSIKTKNTTCLLC